MTDSNAKAIAKDSVTAAKKSPARKAKSTLGRLSLLLALFVLSAAGYVWYEQQQFKKHIDDEFTTLRTRIRTLDTHPALIELKSQLQNTDKQLTNKQQSLTEAIETLNDSMQRISDIANRDQREWILAEVQYLMGIANIRLQLSRDVAATITALNTADNRLNLLADPRLLPVRQQLADELTALKSLPPINIDGALLTLNSIAQRLSLLPRALSAPEATPGNPAASGSDSTEATELTLWQRFIRFISRLAGVQHSRLPQDPKHAEDLLQRLDQQLHLDVEAAKYAALRFDKSDYESRLKNIRQLLEAHYEQSNPHVIRIKDDINLLLQKPAFVELPVITGSLAALQEALAVHPQPDATP